jgi:hypothetical protein
VLQKNEANKLVYVNNEFKDQSLLKSLNIVNVNQTLQPIVEEKKAKSGDTKIKSMKKKDKEGDSDKRCKKHPIDSIGNNIDMEG